MMSRDDDDGADYVPLLSDFRRISKITEIELFVALARASFFVSRSETLHG